MLRVSTGVNIKVDAFIYSADTPEDTPDWFKEMVKSKRIVFSGPKYEWALRSVVGYIDCSEETVLMGDADEGTWFRHGYWICRITDGSVGGDYSVFALTPDLFYMFFGYDAENMEELEISGDLSNEV